MYRKDFTQLTSSELAALANAFNALSANGTIGNYVTFHSANSSKIHRGPAFLPWHRYFLRRFEQALQAEDSSVTLPYWDWTRVDSRDLDEDPWESFFGGWDGTGRLSWSVARDNSSSRTLPTLASIIRELGASTYRAFRSMESGSHVDGHVWVGGDMRDVSRSPNDPLFYLHHCNIDRLWAIWQQHNAEQDQYSTTAISNDLGNTAATVELTESMAGMGEDRPTPESMLDHTALGYRYERDILLEAAWFEAKESVLQTGDRRSADLFIRDSDSDDGTYPSAHVHWQSPDIWVRNNVPEEGERNTASDHERPIVGSNNYMYVNIQNRGSQRAGNVKVRAYHCNPGLGMLWPNDFEAMGERSVAGGIESGASAIVGPFPWNPEIEDHECLLAVVDSPDDPTMASMFHEKRPGSHWHLVRFDNSVGQRNVSPIRITTEGRAVSDIGMKGSTSASTNAFRLNAKKLPRDTSVRLRVANGVLRDAKLSALRTVKMNPRYTTLQMRGGEVAAIEGFRLAARETKKIQLAVDFSVEAKHEHRYPLVATQIQDGETAGQLTIEFVAIKDHEDYVYGNKSSMELHTIRCPFWSRMNPKNRVPFLAVEEALARGYNGCHFCLPRHDRPPVG